MDQNITLLFNVGISCTFFFLKWTNIDNAHIITQGIQQNLSWKTTLIGHKNMVRQGRWSLVTGSIAFKCAIFWQDYVVIHKTGGLS